MANLSRKKIFKEKKHGGGGKLSLLIISVGSHKGVPLNTDVFLGVTIQLSLAQLKLDVTPSKNLQTGLSNGKFP